MPINPPQSSIWETVPGLIDRLKAAVALSLSFSEIARDLGHGLSRNAVCGKMYRLGLTRPRKYGVTQQTENTAKRVREKSRLHISSTSSHPIMEYIEKLDFTPTTSDTEIPLTQRKTLLQLKAHHCRFPIGDPKETDFFFCGAPIVEGKPYCAHHAEVCYTSLPPRRSPQRPVW